MAPEALPRDLLAPYLQGGMVDYEALEAGVDFAAVTAAIAAFEPAAAGREERLAFYLNAYNLLVLHAVLRRLRRNRAWPGCVSAGDKLRFFLAARHRVAGRRMSLYALENRVIRRAFHDPRVHFALNCASRSCPPLPARLFHADTLDEDLEHLTRDFLHSDAVRLDRDAGRLDLSRIFKWYARDFRPSSTAFIARYRDLPADVSVTYQPYDWSLNRRVEGSGREQVEIAR